MYKILKIPHPKFVRINEFSKAVGYKVYTRKSVAFLYTNNEHSEKKVTKTIPFMRASKIKK